MLDCAKDGHALTRFSAEESAELDEAEAAVARGDFASDAEIQALWAKRGLKSYVPHALSFVRIR